MPEIYENIEALVGNTPMVKLARFSEKLGLKTPLLAKLESYNPTGSVKDRVALAMILAAENSGQLKPGDTLIEPTSGNTGVGLAAIGKARGYHVLIVMPASMSEERRKLMKIYGAELLLTPAKEGMSGAIRHAKALAEKHKDYFLVGQFQNPENSFYHERVTGPEIFRQVDGQIDAFVAGVGTGGTVTGVARALKARNEQIQIIAVEPANSPVIAGGMAGAHGLQGIGAGFLPEIFDRTVCDHISAVTEQEAYEMVRLLAQTEGYFVGVSAGAALVAAKNYAQAHEDDQIVVLLPDTGARYLSVDALMEAGKEI